MDDRRALRAKVEARAAALGFARLGVARAERLDREAVALERWIERGDHGSMRWMEETVEVRADPTHAGMLPSAKSVIVLATPYARAEAARGPSPGLVARYAQGRDYHNVVGKRTRKLAALLRDEGFAARAGTDTLPILERAWAQRAGVGFIGKNCCLIVPGLGSHVLLSVIVTSATLPTDSPMTERCGSCRACLDACPTEAFRAPRALDARRCIAYLTIEHRGAIAPELRPKIGAHLFGCDDCQDVCPFNRTPPPPPDDTVPFAAHPRLEVDAQSVLRMDEEAYRAWAHGSPLARPGRASMARNAAIVLGNAGDRRHLPVLREALHDPDETVRDVSAWALAKLESKA